MTKLGRSPRNLVQKPSKRESTVSLTDLGLLLGLDGDTVAMLARKSRLPVPKGGRSRIPWSLVGVRLNLEEAHRLRVESANTKRRLRTSMHWIAGYAELVEQWDTERNGDLYPWQVSRGSGKRVWWRCPKGSDHVWQQAAGTRVRGNGCPFCANHRASITNCLANVAPSIAAEWHPTKNGTLTPRDVVAGGFREVWWKCTAGPDHEWQQTLYSRCADGHGCLMCAGYRVSVTNSLRLLFPAVAAQWHPSKNGDLRLEEMVRGSKRRVWWKCPRGPDHEWQGTIVHRTSDGVGCPICNHRRAAPSTSIAALSPKLASEWHPKKNGALGPGDVSPYSSKRVWWKCPKGPDHEWSVSPQRRYVQRTGCPSCRGFRPSGTNSLATQYPDVAKQWHPTKNGALSPHSVTWGSKKSVWWQCVRERSHVWETTVVHRTSDGHGCPLCAGRRVGPDNALARHRSIAREWHPFMNLPLTPRDVVAGSNRRVWWRCRNDERHIWRTTPVKRTSSGSGCPYCRGRRRPSPSETEAAWRAEELARAR